MNLALAASGLVLATVVAGAFARQDSVSSAGTSAPQRGAPRRDGDAAAILPERTAIARPMAAAIESEPPAFVGEVRRRDDDEPIEGALIILNEPQGTERFTLLRTDPLGRFRVAVKGIAEMDVRAGGFAPLRCKHAFWWSDDLSIPIVIRLPAVANLVGIVVDHAGRPVYGATISPTWLHPRPECLDALTCVLGARTDLEGSFRIEGFPIDAPFFVVAEEAMHAPGRSDAATLLEILEQGPGVTIVLPWTTSVAGIARFEDGQLVARSMIELENADDRLLDVSRSTGTDESGHFRFECVPAGSFVVSTADEEDLGAVNFTVKENRSVPDLRLTVRVVPPPAIEEVPVPLTIRGRVLGIEARLARAFADSEHVDWQSIRATSGRDEFEGLIEQDGTFCINGVPPGNWTIRPRDASKLEADFEPFEAAAGSEGWLISAKPTRARARGRLACSASARCEQELLALRRGLDADESIRWSAVGGGFEFDHLGAGDYELSIESDSHASEVIARFHLGADDALDLGTIDLAEPRLIRGRLVDPEGVPLAGVRVRLLGSGGLPRATRVLAWLLDEVRETESDDDGVFELVDEHDARALFVKGTSGAPTMLWLEDVADRSRVEFRIDPGATLRGRVVDAAGRPFPHLEITATAPNRPVEDFAGSRSSSDEHLTAITGSDGRFELRGLERRRYFVTPETWKPVGAATIVDVDRAIFELPDIVVH